jgi:hypothetical protein
VGIDATFDACFDNRSRLVSRRVFPANASYSNEQNNKHGRLVPRGDVQALASAMQELLDDPAKRERLGAAALERSRLFTVAETLPQFEALYRDVVARGEAAANPPTTQHVDALLHTADRDSG